MKINWTIRFKNRAFVTRFALALVFWLTLVSNSKISQAGERCLACLVNSYQTLIW